MYALQIHCWQHSAPQSNDRFNNSGRPQAHTSRQKSVFLSPCIATVTVEFQSSLLYFTKLSIWWLRGAYISSLDVLAQFSWGFVYLANVRELWDRWCCWLFFSEYFELCCSARLEERARNSQIQFIIDINLSKGFYCFPSDLLVGDVMVPAGSAAKLSCDGAAIDPCPAF